MIFSIKTQLNPIFVLLPTLFILASEAPPQKLFYTLTDRNFRCYKCSFTVSLTQEEIIKELEKMNFNVVRNDKGFYGHRTNTNHNKDTLQENTGYRYNFAKYYRIDKLIIDNDTLQNVDFSLINLRNGKTEIYFNGFDYNKTISSKKMKRKLRRYYKKLVKKYFKNKFKR